jgi:ElaB/YqjD/DUF883 family membrane-anchored ribosome-binding protein
MASAQAQARTKGRTRRRNGSTARRKATLSNARRTMQRAVSDDAAAMRAEVDDMIASLEERIGRINALTKQGAGHAADGVNELLLNAISGLTGQVADRAKGNAMSMSDEVAKLGTNALRRVVREIDRRPLLTVAIAAGIGFVVAMARRPE